MNRPLNIIDFYGTNMHKKTAILIILDGWGYSKALEFNAIYHANTLNWDQLWQHAAHTLINASGSLVGLPQGQMGNSEVGHINIGAGRVVYQELTRIDKAIKENIFSDNVVLNQAIERILPSDNALHIMGLLSPGGVHAHEQHMMEMVKLAAQKGVKKVYVHAILDGRDTPPKSAEPSIIAMENLLSQLGIGYIASVSGRYYAMDRDNRWDRIEKAYHAMVLADTEFSAKDANSALKMAYARGESDEFVLPTAIIKDNKEITINNGESVVFMNFRADRAREITHAFVDNDFTQFTRKAHPAVHFVTLTEYAKDIGVPAAFLPEKLNNTLGAVCEQHKLTQLRVAETEKYAHVTFFLNGGHEKPFNGEDRILVPSPKIATYDLKPEMSAYEVTEKLVAAIYAEKYNLIVCNYANADMVGHTGHYPQALKAIEALDACLGKVVKAVQSKDADLFITADHGNAEKMVDPITQKAHTAHTTNPVPFVYFGNQTAEIALTDAKLSDIAPTILAAMGVQKPIEMTGQPIFTFQQP